MTLTQRRISILLMPVAVLIATRLAAHVFVTVLPLNVAWLPTFAAYYASMTLCYWFAVRWLAMDPLNFRSGLLPLPHWRLLLLGIVLPALLPVMAFVTHATQVSTPLWLGVVTFALVNPFFEEGFWRGVLHHLPASPVLRTLYSATLFSFSHWLLWAAYWMRDPLVWIPMVVATFLMGLAWSWFVQRDRRITYPVLSHMMVDFLNLGAAVYAGLQLHTG